MTVFRCHFLGLGAKYPRKHGVGMGQPHSLGAHWVVVEKHHQVIFDIY
jgi:hypothetical protein